MSSSIKPFINEEIENYLKSILPLLNNHNHNNFFVSSCIQQQDACNNDPSTTKNTQQKQLQLLKTVSNFLQEHRENGTYFLTLKPDQQSQTHSGDSTSTYKLQSVSHYKEGLKAAQWIFGFFCSSSQSCLISRKEKANEQVLSIKQLFEMYYYSVVQAENPNQKKILTLLLFTILPSICAMLSNGALALIQEKKFLQAQRWCERGIVQVENYLSAASCSGFNVEEENSLQKTTCTSIFNLGLKLQYRLGLALEGQVAFSEAAKAFEDCCAKANSAQQHQFVEVDDKILKQMINDATIKMNQCREKRKQQVEKQRGNMMSGMFN
jgi:hypothetical protein